jgi:hypothetical protein
MPDAFETALDRMEAPARGLYSLLLLDGVNAVQMISAVAAGDRTAMAYVSCVRECSPKSCRPFSRSSGLG